MSRPMRTPSYRLHKPSGNAVVTLDGRDIYLGKHGSLEARDSYDRTIAEWLACGRTIPDRGNESPTISELMLCYVKHCEQYFAPREGAESNHLRMIKLSLRVLRRLYGQDDG